jgi:hypothetical protein
MYAGGPLRGAKTVTLRVATRRAPQTVTECLRGKTDYNVLVANVLLALAVPVIGVCGVIIGSHLTTRRENDRIRRDLSLERYREGQQLFDDLIKLAGERFTAMQRWLWAMENPGRYDLDAVRRNYIDLVQSWNTLTWSYRARLRLMLGDAIALRYLDYDDDERGEKPESLHYKFVMAHRLLLNCERGTKSPAQVQPVIHRLNHAWSNFADDVASELLRRAVNLRLLDMPGGAATPRGTSGGSRS